MSSRLSCINDWENSARRVRYQPFALAKHYKVSLRQLERYFVMRFGATPHVWLDKVRLRDATECLTRGDSVKAVALDVGFGSSSNFCRWYKRATGITPTEIRS